MELQNLKVEKNGINSKYTLTANLLNKLLHLMSTGSFCCRRKIEGLLKEGKESYEIDRTFFSEIIDDIYKKANLLVEVGYINAGSESGEFLKINIDSFNKALDEYAQYRGFQIGEEIIYPPTLGLEFYLDEKRILEFLQLAENLKQQQELYCAFRDLFEAKKSVEESLKYCATEEEIDSFISEYNRSIESHDSKQMKEALEHAQQLILKHWGEYTTKIEDYKPGEQFKFICHSTSSTEFDGPFYTKYVSASLITNNVMGTYRNGFGFILEPKNIVGADSKDLFVMNTASTSDELLTYSTIKRIKAPEMVVEECIRTEQKRIKEESIQPTYNEVVVDGFNPIGIFCLTDGSKSLNYNYKCAKKLQKQFPQLPLVEIDKMLYLAGDKLRDTKRNLLKNVMTAHAERDPKYADLDYELHYEVTDEMIRSYDFFFKEYMELKQKEGYNESDIIELYGKVKKMFEMNFFSSYAFDGFTAEEIKTILLYNNKTRIIDILEGKVYLYALDQIYGALRNHASNEKLRVIPGLNDFLTLYKKVSFTEEQVEELKGSASFEEINEHLRNFISDSENKRINELLNQKQEHQARIEECERKIALNREKIAKYNEAQRIIDCEFWYALNNMSLELYNADRKPYDESIKSYIARKNKIILALERVKKELENLNRHKLLHRLLHRRAIKKKKQEQIRLQNNLAITERNIDACKTKLIETDKKIAATISRFKEKTGLDMSKYAEKLGDAKKDKESINKSELDEENINLTAEKARLSEELDRIERKLIIAQGTSNVMLTSDDEKRNTI